MSKIDENLYKIFENVESVDKQEAKNLDDVVKMNPIQLKGNYTIADNDAKKKELIRASKEYALLKLQENETSKGKGKGKGNNVAQDYVNKAKELGVGELSYLFHPEIAQTRLKQSQDMGNKWSKDRMEDIAERRKIKQMARGQDKFTVFEKKSQKEANDSGDFNTPLEQVFSKNCFSRAGITNRTIGDVNFESFITALSKIYDELDEISNEYAKQTQEENLEQNVTEVVTLSNWARIKLEARSWLRRQANKLIALLQKI